MLRYYGKKDPRRRANAEELGVLEVTAETVGSGRLDGTELGPVRRYRKTSETLAIGPMPEAYEVETLEGRHTGKAGSFLAIGAQGELYPIDASIFEETYELVEEE